jgi:hypothetical protein
MLRRHLQRTSDTRFDLAVAPQVVLAHRRGAIQIAHGYGGVEIAHVGHDIEGPRRVVGMAYREAVVVHDAEHLDAFHRFDRGQHLAVSLPDFADLFARQVEEILRDAAAEQNTQRQR